jgi:hypothetical protein
MIGIVIFLCLLAGPNAGWVKKFLPNTATRLVFLALMLLIMALGIEQEIRAIADTATLGCAIAVSIGIISGLFALWRFVNAWWIRSERLALTVDRVLKPAASSPPQPTL